MDASSQPSYQECREVLAGAQPRSVTYGVSNDDALEAGLPCGGVLHCYVSKLGPDLVDPLVSVVRSETGGVLAMTTSGPAIGTARVVEAGPAEEGDPVEQAARAYLALGETGTVSIQGAKVFLAAFPPKPRMLVIGAIDFAAALAWAGRFLGYHVTVCDARARYVTSERIPHADELVVDWPDRFLQSTSIDERTAICVLTHDPKFDLPALRVALESPAGYVGAMGSRRVTKERETMLLQSGVTRSDLARLHAPIGLPIASRAPEEVAVAIVAEIIASKPERARERSLEPVAAVA